MWRICTMQRIRMSEAISSDGIDMRKRAEVSPSHNELIIQPLLNLYLNNPRVVIKV